MLEIQKLWLLRKEKYVPVFPSLEALAHSSIIDEIFRLSPVAILPNFKGKKNLFSRQPL